MVNLQSVALRPFWISKLKLRGAALHSMSDLAFRFWCFKGSLLFEPTFDNSFGADDNFSFRLRDHLFFTAVPRAGGNRSLFAWRLIFELKGGVLIRYFAERLSAWISIHWLRSRSSIFSAQA